ncbi:MAG: threonylcarbamoyl-AMP synthase [Microlunatus sp.]|nr:threonylcarbamoyl-AMP synthase [Microlunatus sp.]MDN5804487.1 threonylcarbamoyl-AMP synthase [Microlunatus sp.]
MSAVPHDEPEDPGYRRWDCMVEDPEVLVRAEADARTAIVAGECIVLPTDTVYGIGADAFNAAAVQRLLDIKVRGRDMPPPVLIAEPTLIRALATDIPDEARQLVAAHWPGPLTIILKRQPSLKMDLGDTEGTVALRVPDHELARDILRATGPMAVSSANVSGLPAALTCDDAVGQLGASVAVYLDVGRLGEDGQPASTIVDFTQADHGQVLRRGALSAAVLREISPDLEDLVADGGEAEVQEAPEGDGKTGVGDAEVIKQEILATELDESADEPSTDEPSTDEPAVDEPSTDEPSSTHPDHDSDQPNLFEQRT